MISFDIETMPNKAMIDRLPPVEADSRLKDPAKIEASIAAAKAKQVADMALSPLWGRVVMWATNEGNYVIIEEDTDDCERNVIETAFNVIRGHEFCTFNGMSFDVPYLYRRAVMLGIKTPGPMSRFCKRYSLTPHMDIRMVWTNWSSYEAGSLGVLASAILGEGKGEWDHTNTAAAIESCATADLIGYCIQDCKLTYDLYKRFEGVLI